MLKITTTAALLLIGAVSLTSCSSSENNETENTTEGVYFVGSIASDTNTRTSLEGTFPGTGGAVEYFWETGDKIFLEDGRSANADITAKAASAKFYFSNSGSGDLTDAQYNVYYTGTSGTSYNSVTIASTQTQSAANNSEHLGASGDCGTAVATRQSNGSYTFSLNHKAAYLCLLTRSVVPVNKAVKLTKVVIKAESGKNIAGKYTLDMTNGLTYASDGSDSITLNAGASNSGFALPIVTEQTDNAIYVVMAPTTTALTITYTVYDSTTENSTNITRTLSSKTYEANKVYPITANVLSEYTNITHSAWDATSDIFAVNTLTDTVSGKSITRLSSSTDVRYWNTGTGTATNMSANNPTPNEFSWYISAGAYWDSSKAWIIYGHLYYGGVWFKKSSAITGFTSTVGSDGTTNYNASTASKNTTLQNGTITVGKPADSDSANYFFVPAAGSVYSLNTSSASWKEVGVVTGNPYQGLNFWSNYSSSASFAIYLVAKSTELKLYAVQKRVVAAANLSSTYWQ